MLISSWRKRVKIPPASQQGSSQRHTNPVGAPQVLSSLEDLEISANTTADSPAQLTPASATTENTTSTSVGEAQGATTAGDG